MKMQEIADRLSFHRLADSLISWDRWGAASDTATGTVLPCQAGREPCVPWATLPAATQCGQPAATLGWAQPRVRCRCGSGVGPEPSNTARRGFILPDFRLPAGMPKSHSGPCSRERCVCSEKLKAIYFAVFFCWRGRHQDAEDRRVSGGLSEHLPLGMYLCKWSPGGCQRSLSTWPLRGTGWGPLFPEPFARQPVPRSGKPRVLQRRYWIRSLARPSAQPGHRQTGSRSP